MIKSCLFGHKWLFRKPYTVRMERVLMLQEMEIRKGQQFDVTMQEKRCVRCNKVDIEEVRRVWIGK